MQDSQTAATKAIRLNLAARNQKQPWLAEQIGRSPFWLSRRMTGGISFKIDELEQIAQVFGRSLEELLADADKIAVAVAS